VYESFVVLKHRLQGIGRWPARMLSIGQKMGMSERKNSVDGQSGVARSSDSAMNTEDAGGIQKGKLPIIAWEGIKLGR